MALPFIVLAIGFYLVFGHAPNMSEGFRTIAHSLKTRLWANHFVIDDIGRIFVFSTYK